MEYNSPEFQKWLDKLQRESWQLELIISGFAIYGLILAYEPIAIKAMHALQTEQIIHNQMLGLVGIAVLILIINLIGHVILRGLWIGAIGLRYVSGDIDFDNLNYSEKFTIYLKKKVGSFDKFIAKLENFCSALFALSFLMIFYLLAFFAIISFIAFFGALLAELDFLPKIVRTTIIVVFGLTFIFGALMVFVDFVGQGILKKRKWTSIIYFPFYKVFSFLTLSFLYRPLVYNFLDNKFSRRLSISIVPFYIMLALLGSFDEISSNYLSNDKPSSASFSNPNNYEDSTLEKQKFVHVAAIPSKTIQTNYLKVFLMYKKEMEDFVFKSNTSLKPKEDNRGAGLTFVDDFKKGFEMAQNKGVAKDSILPDYLKTFNKIYILEIDDIKYESDFVVSHDSEGVLGFEAYLDIKDLKDGKHLLSIKGPGKKDIFDDKSEAVEKTLVTIPFWYFPKNTSRVISNVNAYLEDTTK